MQKILIIFVSLLLSSIAFAALSGSTPEIEAAITRASIKHGVDPELIRSVIKAESEFNPNAHSTLSSGKPGAEGLMQLMPATAAEMGIVDSFNIDQNVDGGTKYLAQMLSAHNGDITLALAAYNAGPGNVRKYNGVPPFAETTNYITKISGFLTAQGAPPLNLASLSSAGSTVPHAGFASSATFAAIVLPTNAQVMSAFEAGTGLNASNLKFGIKALFFVVMFIWFGWQTMSIISVWSAGRLKAFPAFFTWIRSSVVMLFILGFIRLS